MNKDCNKLMNSSSVHKVTELMKNVVVYVEVRTHEDNRSEGIKKVISSLGAKVSNRLTKNTTHVIFKDGQLSTYKRAKQLNIPLVSILWIEACKKSGQIMDPTLFPISNLDRYEFPEIYDKFKRIKSMQPDAIDKKRLNVKQGQNTKNAKANESPSLTKLRAPQIPRTPKDNLNNILSEFQDKMMSTPDNDESFVFKSKLLEKIQNSPYTPKTTNKNIYKEKICKPVLSENNIEVSTNFSISIRESARTKKMNPLYHNADFLTRTEPIKRQQNRRRTIASTPNQSKLNGTKDISSFFTPVREKILEQSKQSTLFKTPGNAPSKSTVTDQNSNNVEISGQQSGVENVHEENDYNDILTPVNHERNKIHTRRTLYTPTTMEISKQSEFSSVRKPNNRRKTLFDISLDIIDKSLKSINQQSKVNKTVIDEFSIKDHTDVTRIEDLQDDLQSTPVNNSNSTPILKRRKLFVPDQFDLTPVAEFNKNILSSTKRIRETNTEFNIESCDKKKRRLTIDAQSFNFDKENRRTSSFDFDLKLFPGGLKPLNKCKEQNLNKFSIPVTAPIKKVLVWTNMHREQQEFIEKVVKSLGDFEIESNVSDKTTHVVSLECRRTINLIKGIVRGLWILKYEWIIDSFNAGKWLQEESYELTEFSRSVEICRSERQAIGPKYRMEILSGLGTIYVSNKCKVPVNSLKEIIKLCSGTVVNSPQDCKYVIGDYYKEKICVQPQWILDSIMNNKVMKFSKYTIFAET